MTPLETFIAKSQTIHGDRYDYSLVDYKTMHQPVDIICPIHGIFPKRPDAHIYQKQGCPSCPKKHSNAKTTEQFIKQAMDKWGDKYDYTKTNYINKQTKIKYDCPDHGEVEQSPTQHLKNGCPFCSGRGVGKYIPELFIKRAREVHGDRYDYSLITEINGVNSDVPIICKTHGMFLQKAANHINIPNGCPSCNGGVSIDTNEFIARAETIHGDKFDYSNTIYTKSHELVKVVCPKHGEFEQLAYMHLQSTYACPYCVAELTSSAAEKEIVEFIKQYYNGEIKTNDRKTFGYKEIDILLPEFSLGIEFHGNYWHTEAVVGRNYHAEKAKLAQDNNIKLIQFFEYEWDNKKDIIKSRLLNSLGFSEKVFARNTEVIELTLDEKNNFLERTHLFGKDNSSIFYGLKYNNEIVACITFGKPRFSKGYNWELIRYSSKLGVGVSGGASKLFKHFTKNHTGSIISYADKRWSTGNLYKALGFAYNGETSPGYVYYHLNKKTVASRMSFQKHKLNKMPIYDPNLSEYEIMKLNGYERIWDAGHSRWIFN